MKLFRPLSKPHMWETEAEARGTLMPDMLARERRLADQKIEQDLKQRRAEEERRAKEQARRAEIAARQDLSLERPAEHAPPSSPEALERALARGQCRFDDASLDFDGAEVSLDLAGMSFRGASLRNVRFSAASSLEAANFAGARLHNVTFASGCTCRNTNFARAEFRNVTFEEGCIVTRASFQGLAYVQGWTVQLDANAVAGTDLSRTGSDWVRLSRRYRGMAQVLGMILLLGAGRGSAWRGWRARGTAR
ncbi:pentapeptide repeat-containing protein, partial [Pararhodobacter marinus]